MSPGANDLVNGTATYNIADLKPEVVANGSNIEIKEGDLKSIPFSSGMKNNWDLKLGSTPMDLTVHAGAYKGTYELGGLALTGLTIQDGAANTKLSFAQPNKAAMTILRYETGASSVKLTGLANANFGTLIFNSGAGDYTLDFSGTLKTRRDGHGLERHQQPYPCGTAGRHRKRDRGQQSLQCKCRLGMEPERKRLLPERLRPGADLYRQDGRGKPDAYALGKVQFPAKSRKTFQKSE